MNDPTEPKPDYDLPRQPQRIIVTFTDDARDIRSYMEKFKRSLAASSYDYVVTIGNQFVIHPAAVND